MAPMTALTVCTRTSFGALTTAMPSVMPPMATISAGWSSRPMWPPAMVKAPSAAPSTIMYPMITNMSQDFRYRSGGGELYSRAPRGNLLMHHARDVAPEADDRLRVDLADAGLGE